MEGENEGAGVVSGGSVEPIAQSPASSERVFGGGKVGRRTPSDLLRAMRWVAKHAEKPEETVLQKTCRNLLKQDDKAFISQLAKLESEYRAMRERSWEAQSAAKAALGSPLEPDLGTDRCLELVEQLIGEAEGEARK